jgi:small subunit ribosomal protein S18
MEDIEDKKIVGKTEEASESEYASDKKKPRRKRKIIQNLTCPLCETGVKEISYKDVYQLKKFTSVRGKFISTEKSGVCHKHQKALNRAIKRARYMSLLPYVAKDA